MDRLAPIFVKIVIRFETELAPDVQAPPLEKNFDGAEAICCIVAHAEILGVSVPQLLVDDVSRVLRVARRRHAGRAARRIAGVRRNLAGPGFGYSRADGRAEVRGAPTTLGSHAHGRAAAGGARPDGGPLEGSRRAAGAVCRPRRRSQKGGRVPRAPPARGPPDPELLLSRQPLSRGAEGARGARARRAAPPSKAPPAGPMRRWSGGEGPPGPPA